MRRSSSLDQGWKKIHRQSKSLTYSSYYIHFECRRYSGGSFCSTGNWRGAGRGLWMFNMLQLPLLLMNWMEGREEHS